MFGRYYEVRGKKLVLVNKGCHFTWTSWVWPRPHPWFAMEPKMFISVSTICRLLEDLGYREKEDGYYSKSSRPVFYVGCIGVYKVNIGCSYYHPTRPLSLIYHYERDEGKPLEYIRALIETNEWE